MDTKDDETAIIDGEPTPSDPQKLAEMISASIAEMGKSIDDYMSKSEVNQVVRSASSNEQDWAPAVKMHRKQHSMSEDSFDLEPHALERGTALSQSTHRRAIKKSRVKIILIKIDSSFSLKKTITWNKNKTLTEKFRAFSSKSTEFKVAVPFLDVNYWQIHAKQNKIALFYVSLRKVM